MGTDGAGATQAMGTTDYKRSGVGSSGKEVRCGGFMLFFIRVFLFYFCWFRFNKFGYVAMLMASFSITS